MAARSFLVDTLGVGVSLSSGATYQAVSAVAAQAGYVITRTSADILVRLTDVPGVDLNVNGTFARPSAQVGDLVALVRHLGGAGLWSLVGGDSSDVLRGRDDWIQYQCIAAPSTWARVLPAGRDKRLVYRLNGSTTPTLTLDGGWDGVDIVVHSGACMVSLPNNLGTRFHCRLIQQTAGAPVSIEYLSGATPPVDAIQPTTTAGIGTELDLLVIQNASGTTAVYRTLLHVPMLAVGAIIPASGDLDFSGTNAGDVLTVLPGGGIAAAPPAVTAIEPQQPSQIASTPYVLTETEGLEDQKWVLANSGSSVFLVPNSASAGRAWIIENNTAVTKQIEIVGGAGSLNGASGSTPVFLAAGIGRRVTITVRANGGSAPTVQVSGDTTETKFLDGPLSLNAQTINPGTPTPVTGARLYGAADSGKTFNVTTAGTQTIPAGLAAGWTVDIWNSDVTAPSDVTTDGPGGTNVTLASGEVATVKYLTTTLIRVAKGASTVIS